jgi:hypothetical protein
MNDREKMLDKIRALLSKRTENGCTEDEELAALAKAQELMDAYEVSDADLAIAREEGAILRSEPPGTKDLHSIKFALGNAVAKFTDCRAWTQDGGMCFCGLPSDARFATWLLDHLTNFVQSELASYLMGVDVTVGMPRRRAINGFVIGITGRISQRLYELRERTTAPATANSRALVATKHQLIKAKMEELGIRPRSKTFWRRFNLSSLDAGRAAGDRASFGRPVSGQVGALRIESKK